MKSLLFVMFLPAFSFAGPGVSSVDESLKSYTCAMSGVMDSGYVANFENVHGEKPQATLTIGIGEYQYKNLNGVCSRVENVDEFYLNCVFVNGFDIYQAALNSEGAPTLVSSVRRLNSEDSVSKLACYVDTK